MNTVRANMPFSHPSIPIYQAYFHSNPEKPITIIPHLLRVSFCQCCLTKRWKSKLFCPSIHLHNLRSYILFTSPSPFQSCHSSRLLVLQGAPEGLYMHWLALFWTVRYFIELKNYQELKLLRQQASTFNLCSPEKKFDNSTSSYWVASYKGYI